MQNNVLATVNGKQITEKDLEITISRFPREKQSYFSSEQGKKQLLEQIISFELIYNYAKEEGLEEEQEYLVQLEALKKEILTQVAVKKIVGQATVTNEEIEAYYHANQNVFKTEETVSAKHILVDTFEKAQEIENKIKAGMLFEEAAEKFSSCPSKDHGGNLGSFGRGRMVPEFEKAAFELGVGVVSGPVQTQFGYHLIKVEEKAEGSIKPLTEVKELIQGELLQERQSYQYAKFTEELKNKYKVEMA